MAQNMDEQSTVSADTSNGEATDQSAETLTETVDVSKLQAEKAELETKNRQLFERAKKAEGFTLQNGHWVKAERPAQTATGEAEDTVALLLEVKGLKEDDEVALFQKWKDETNRAPRTILNNSIFQAELQALRTDKATQAAIPSSNGRGGGGGTLNLDAAVEKFTRTGELPKAFDAKARVLDIARSRLNSKTPPWRR